MECEAITRHLHTLADASYKAFNARLIPNVAPETMIGIRLPRLRSYAKELLQSDEDNGTHVVKDFLGTLPHALFEENMLHAMLLSLAAHSTDEACGMRPWPCFSRMLRTSCVWMAGPTTKAFRRLVNHAVSPTNGSRIFGP